MDDLRVGVYICHCGLNIAATVNPAEVAKFALTLPGVAVARNYLFMCSQPGQELIRNDIKEYKLNRVVVASCSPLMHEKTFRRVCQEGGINPYLFEMANIREHCSWVHLEGATDKAKELVRAAVMKVRDDDQLFAKEVSVNKNTLIVGGGIAGIQAALDIANSGYQVYLIEREPSIGGHMIQLDKTFPTLDCSACIMTPKMSDAGSHPNIHLMTYSEVEEISGFVGNFKAKIRQKARYVDITKCTGCGFCFPTCPVVMKNEFDQNLADRKAVYIPFPQAVPNKATIDMREERPCKAACVETCPVHMNVLGYIKLAAQGKFKEAYQLMRETNPLPSTCGRVCYAPCEGTCNRGQMDEPLAIRQLKMFISDQVNLDEFPIPQITFSGKKVAVIGAGPAGLSAAHDLALKGHAVTVFEALPEPGGMLRYGIPEYRLPKAVLKKEIQYIQKLGVEIKTGTKVGKDLPAVNLRKDYQAVFIAPGAPNGMKLSIKGEDLTGVMDGLHFLRSVNQGEKVGLGSKVAVIGGGNTAIDCARAAKRLGAADVTVVYRRTRSEMPASVEEIEAMEQEGVKIEFLAAPKIFIAKEKQKQLGKMECIRMKLGDPDASGRPKPVPVEGSEFTIETDQVISALGQIAEADILKDLGISLTKGNNIEINSKTGMTPVEGIFAGGDVVTGAAYVIEAIAAGKRAARSIDRYLKGEPLEIEEKEPTPEKLSEEEVASLKTRYPAEKRIHMKEAAAAERSKDFKEVALGFTAEEAQAEAARCLAGKIEGCIQCFECARHCEAQALRYDMKEETVEVEVGNIIVTTGYQEFNPSVIPQYGYGKFENVITGLEFERLSNASGPTGGAIRMKNGEVPQRVAIVHCVGSRDKNYHEYCSRVCCMFGLKFAHLLRDKTGAEVFQMYIDMRCFGEGYEEFYERTGTEDGIKFIRGKVSRVTDRTMNDDEKGKLVVVVEDTLLSKIVRVPVDMVVLCSALEPRADAEGMARLFSIGRRADGFFMERHVKLDPVKTMADGILIAGCAEGPKDIPDTVAQAKASAAEVLGMLAKGKVEIEPIVSIVDEDVCAGCGMCETICAYGAPAVDPVEHKSKVNQALCKGCGACAALCPSGAIRLLNFTSRQMMDEIEALTG